MANRILVLTQLSLNAFFDSMTLSSQRAEPDNIPACGCISDFQGLVVRNWVKIIQGKCEIWTQLWELKKQIQFNSLCLQFDDWIL